VACVFAHFAFYLQRLLHTRDCNCTNKPKGTILDDLEDSDNQRDEEQGFETIVNDDNHSHGPILSVESTDTEDTEETHHNNTSLESGISIDSTTHCLVCLERLENIVSWSTNANCGHVFHHACIKEWLLTHADCPLCRCTFLPVDNNNKHGNFETWTMQWKMRMTTTYCTCTNGLQQTTACIPRRTWHPRIRKDELEQLRS